MSTQRPPEGSTRIEHHATENMYRAMVYREGVLDATKPTGWAIFPGWHFLGDFGSEEAAQARLDEWKELGR